MRPFENFADVGRYARRVAQGPFGALMLGRAKVKPALFRAHWHPLEPYTVVIGGRVG